MSIKNGKEGLIFIIGLIFGAAFMAVFAAR
jgi:hypothetical protein